MQWQRSPGFQKLLPENLEWMNANSIGQRWKLQQFDTMRCSCFLSTSRPCSVGSAFTAFRLHYDFWWHHPVQRLVTNVRISKLLAHIDIEHPLSNRSMLETLGSPLLRFGFLTPQYMSQTNCTQESCMAAIRRVARNFYGGTQTTIKS